VALSVPRLVTAAEQSATSATPPSQVLDADCTSGEIYYKECPANIFANFKVKWCYWGNPVYGPLFKVMALTIDPPDSINLFHKLTLSTQSVNGCQVTPEQNFGTFHEVFIPPPLGLPGQWMGGLVKHQLLVSVDQGPDVPAQAFACDA
jgi:hypothetical protein